MEDILNIQRWLLTIKRQRNFGKFRSVISDLKTRIFAPAHSRSRMSAVGLNLNGALSNTASPDANGGLRESPTFDNVLDDEQEEDIIVDQFEKHQSTVTFDADMPQHGV